MNEASSSISHLNSTFEDEMVMLSNDDSTSCKVSAVTKGYWRDPYFALFAQIHAIHQQFDLKKSPEINVANYARVVSIRQIVMAFVRKHAGKCNIINIGCGFDTLPFWLGDRDALPAAFVDVDLPLVVVRKLKAIRAFPELSQFMPDLVTATSPSRMSSCSRPSSVILELSKPGDTASRTLLAKVKAASSVLTLSRRTSTQSAHSRTTLAANNADKPQLHEQASNTSFRTRDCESVKAISVTSFHPAMAIEDAHLRITSALPKSQQSDTGSKKIIKPARASNDSLSSAKVDDTSCNMYHLVSCDMRSHVDLAAKLSSCELDCELPTLVLAECVLIYLSKENSEELLRTVVGTFKKLQLLVFEQCNLTTPFGKIMMDSLDRRGLHLLGKDSCVTLKTQIDRLERIGLENVRCESMLDILKVLENVDGNRLHRLEMLDEKILLEQLLSLYALTLAAQNLELIDLKSAIDEVSIEEVVN